MSTYNQVSVDHADARSDKFPKPFPVFKSKREVSTPMTTPFIGTNTNQDHQQRIEHYSLGGHDISETLATEERTTKWGNGSYDDQLHQIREATNINAKLMTDILKLIKTNNISRKQTSRSSDRDRNDAMDGSSCHRSRVSQPKEFSGENVLDWLDSMEEWFEIEREPIESWAQLASFRLIGDPLSAWRALKRNHPDEYPIDWDGMRQYLIDNYSNFSIGQAKEEMRFVVWKGDINKLVSELQSIANKAPNFPRDEMIRQAYIKLPDEIALRIKNEEITSIPQLLSIVRLEQEGYRRYNERKRAVGNYHDTMSSVHGNNSRGNGNLKSKPQSAFNNSQNLRVNHGQQSIPNPDPHRSPMRKEPSGGFTKFPMGQNPVYNTIKSINCKNCNGWGHSVNECPNSVKDQLNSNGLTCFSCKGVGHLKSDCPTAKKLRNQGNCRA